MASNAERVLEDAMIVQIQALTAVTANSILVRSWDDDSAPRELPVITVQVDPRERLAPNADFYRLYTQVVYNRQTGDDLAQSVHDDIYNDIAEWASGLTAVSLGVDGVVQDLASQGLQENIYFRGVALNIYDTIT